MEENKHLLSIKDLFGFLCKFFGYDWNEIMKKDRIEASLGEYGMQRDLFNVYRHMNDGNEFLAWKKAVSLLKETLSEFRPKNPEDTRAIREQAEYFLKAADYLDEYKRIREADKEDWRKKLQTMILLTEEEKAQENIVEKCPRSMTDDVWKLLNTPRKLNVYRYAGEAPLAMEKIDRITVGENFLMANDVAKLFGMKLAGDERELKIYVALNIDNILDFSWFMVAINNGDNWWMVTDEPHFVNPDAKTGIARRGSRRYRRDDYEMTVFPYVYLDRIEEWRKENKQVVKENGIGREQYTVLLKEWPVECRAYLNLLIEQVIPKLTRDNGSLKKVRLGSEYTRQMLLSGKTVDADEVEKMKECFASYEANAQRRVDNYILKENGHPEKALAIVDTQKVADKIAVWSGNFMDEETFRKLESWAIYDDEYERRSRMLKVDEETKMQDAKRMRMLLDKNFKNRVEMLFAARKMVVFIYDPDMVYSKDNRFGFNRDMCFHYYNLHSEHRQWYSLLGKIGGDVDEPCPYCNKHQLKKEHTSIIHIVHYAMLAWLAGVKREELPFYFCNYEAHIFYTYVGNHLLENVNPLYLLKDQMSRDYPNGMELTVNLCRRCRTALNKKAMDKAVLVINKNTCQAEGVFDKEAFKQFMDSKGFNESAYLKYNIWDE